MPSKGVRMGVRNGRGCEGVTKNHLHATANSFAYVLVSAPTLYPNLLPLFDGWKCCLTVCRSVNAYGTAAEVVLALGRGVERGETKVDVGIATVGRLAEKPQPATSCTNISRGKVPHKFQFNGLYNYTHTHIQLHIVLSLIYAYQHQCNARCDKRWWRCKKLGSSNRMCNVLSLVVFALSISRFCAFLFSFSLYVGVCVCVLLCAPFCCLFISQKMQWGAPRCERWCPRESELTRPLVCLCLDTKKEEKRKSIFKWSNL